MHIVVSKPQTMRTEERVFFVPQPGFDQFTTIEDCLVAKLLLDSSQELARLVEGHGVSSGALVIESNQRSLIRFGVVEKIPDLLCDVSLGTPVIGSPKQPCIACRFAAGGILGVLPGRPRCRLMDDSPNAEVGGLLE